MPNLQSLWLGSNSTTIDQQQGTRLYSVVFEQVPNPLPSSIAAEFASTRRGRPPSRLHMSLAFVKEKEEAMERRG